MMDKDKKQTAERSLNHAVEIIYLLTGEKPFLWHLTNSTNKNTKRILNHTLDIIYLLTGEEYIVVKKNSPHSPIHLLSGEVPVRCDDVVVYFSMEEWEYIEEHKGLYKDVMMEDHQTPKYFGLPLDRSSGLHNENLDIASINEHGEDKRSNKDTRQVKINPDTCADGSVSSNMLEVFHTAACSSNGTIEDINLPTEGKSHKCNECGKYFAFKFSLVVHQKTHTGEKSHKCNQCGKQFASKSSLVLHQRLHTGEKPHICNECGKQFTYKSNLTSHERIHTGENLHKCKECGKHFLYKNSLNVHQRTHTGEKPHACSECGKHFSGRKTLRVHQKTHTGQTSQKCNVCGKCFTSKSYLVVHQRIHTGEKPHKCTKCEKRFTDKSVLNRHQRIHTREKSDT
ncbi:uncharacterized protein LOC142471288 [Ascaphus truei]|uniref:uncharacterized protein LOC142471288 n=1 Tax=Ascaphus truei TaxID=8439 RepID=UPI003F5A3F5A